MSSRLQVPLVLAAIVVALFLRLPRLDASLGHDEAYTLEAFSSQPVSRLITAYAEPNNHIFHSLLVRLAVTQLGKENWIVRLPALLAGLATVPVIYLLGRALFADAAVGMLAAWLLAVLPIHISHSQAARGYTLLILLTAVSTLFLYRAMRHSRLGDWAVFTLSAFLAAWTLPSGVFHLTSLAVWGAISTTGCRRRSLSIAAGVALVLIALAYLPVRDELASASVRWGIETWADPFAVPQIVLGVFQQFVGGWPGLLPALGAALGIATMVRRRNAARFYLGLAWGVPFLAALITGVGAQPRAFVYLVTGLVLTAALGAIALAAQSRWRLAAGIALIAGHAWTATFHPSPQTVDPYAGLAAYLQSSHHASELVVTPFIMDVRVWTQARDPLAQRLAQVLISGKLERLLFVTDKGDPRFNLESYLLKTPVGAGSLSMPADRFNPVFESGTLQLHALESQAVRLFEQMPGGWSLGTSTREDGPYLEVGSPALGTRSSLRVVNRRRERLQVNSTTSFSTIGEGLLVLVGARTARDSFLSLSEQGPDGSFTRPHLFRMALGPAAVRGKDGSIWFLEALLLRARPQVRYSVYMLCPEAKELAFADVACYLLPFAPP
jgi:hypothetical protein